MLHELLEGLQYSHHAWLILCAKGEYYDQHPSDRVLEILDNGPDASLETAHIERCLAREAENCQACKTKHIQSVGHWASGEEEAGDDEPEDSKDEDRDDEENGPEPEDSQDDEPSPQAEDANSPPTEYPGGIPTSLRKSHEVLKKARCRPSMKPRTPKATIQMIELNPQRFKILRRNKRRDFDDYFHGPSLEDMRMFQRLGGLESQPLDWFSKPTIRSPWELFRDWGYRIEPEFALMFACSKPQKVIEHLLPPPRPHVKKDEPTHPDVCVMGMGEMLDEAGDEGSTGSMEIFIKGTTFDGRLVKLDPVRDSCIPRNYVLSSDLDSIIVTTHRLKVQGDVDIEVLPYSGWQPPIPKSNHTYVELLMPQSENDIESGGRTEWFSTRHSVSTIPHMPFGKIGPFHITVHFPRMKHKDPISNHNATLIPWEVQNLFFIEVLYPAIIAGENPSTMPYKDYTMDQWKWKAANNPKFSGSRKTVVVTADQFDAIQTAMPEIISADPDDLGIFASHYFIMEAKGIKHHTNCVIGEDNTDPYESLCQKFPYLDFEYLQKRENGQLVMDLGLGFHPIGEDDEQLVCLWDLNKLEDLYGAAGMLKGTVHHTNTMANCGGRQAEMGQVRASLVQICFRSTYGLHYEPVRRVRGGEISFCDDADAYNTNTTFMKSCGDYIKMLNGGRTKTYGARDEIRGSGVAICQVLKELPVIVSLYVAVINTCLTDSVAIKLDAAIFKDRTFNLCPLGHLFHLPQAKVERGSKCIAESGEVQTIQLWNIHWHSHAHDSGHLPLTHRKT